MSEPPRIDSANIRELTRRELVEALFVELECVREALDHYNLAVVAWRLSLAMAAALELCRREQQG